MDQRKVNVLAREYCDDIRRENKPIILSHRILISDFDLVLFFFPVNIFLGHMCLSWPCVYSDGIHNKWLFIALFVEHVFFA
jgi:hypothetical protein